MITRSDIAEELNAHSKKWTVSATPWNMLSLNQKEFYLVMADWILAHDAALRQQIRELKEKYDPEHQDDAPTYREIAEVATANAADLRQQLEEVLNVRDEYEENLLNALKVDNLLRTDLAAVREERDALKLVWTPELKTIMTKQLADLQATLSRLERPADQCACGRYADEAVGDPLLDHATTCTVYLTAKLAESQEREKKLEAKLADLQERFTL